MDFGLIADLRFLGERNGKPTSWPDEYSSRLVTPHGDTNEDAPHLTLLRSPSLDEAHIFEFYRAYYARLPFDPVLSPLFGEFIRRLSQTDARALIHCSLGKDRTGVLAALVLMALGVNEEAILADYMLSRDAVDLKAMGPEVNHILRSQLDREVSDMVAERLLLVEREYLLSSFRAITERFGGIQNYLPSIGVDPAEIEALKHRLIG